MKKSFKMLKNKSVTSMFLKRFFIKCAICIVIALSFLIFIKYDSNNKKIIYNFLYKKNITMASINKIYTKYFGNVIPLNKVSNTTEVFNEKIMYKDISKYKNGYKLVTDENYLIPIIESGVVVFIGEKEDYGNTVIIEQVDGVRTWYGNIDKVNVNIYDYVTKNEYLAITNKDYFYLVFEKDNKFIDYKNYLNENKN